MSLLTITPDGSLNAVGDELPLEVMGRTTRTRASHIWPTNRLKRLAFRLIRTVTSDERLAAWTRTWNGPWEAIIIATGQRFISHDRQVCLTWERTVLEDRHTHPNPRRIEPPNHHQPTPPSDVRVPQRDDAEIVEHGSQTRPTYERDHERPST